MRVNIVFSSTNRSSTSIADGIFWRTIVWDEQEVAKPIITSLCSFPWSLLQGLRKYKFQEYLRLSPAVRAVHVFFYCELYAHHYIGQLLDLMVISRRFKYSPKIKDLKSRIVCLSIFSLGFQWAQLTLIGLGTCKPTENSINCAGIIKSNMRCKGIYWLWS